MSNDFRGWRRALVIVTLLLVIGNAVRLGTLSKVSTVNNTSEDHLNITSRYADNPEVKIDPAKVPDQFRHLLPLAMEWSIRDDLELQAYIEAASDEKKREVAKAFAPHFDGLWAWHRSCSHLVPQPDELVLFDDAANAANEVLCLLRDRGE